MECGPVTSTDLVGYQGDQLWLQLEGCYSSQKIWPFLHISFRTVDSVGSSTTDHGQQNNSRSHPISYLLVECEPGRLLGMKTDLAELDFPDSLVPLFWIWILPQLLHR